MLFPIYMYVISPPVTKDSTLSSGTFFKLLELWLPSLKSKVRPIYFKVNTTGKTAEEKMQWENHIWMWELDSKKAEQRRIDAFELWCNPLRCSCLENPRDGAWWAAVSGVAESQTWLKRLAAAAASIQLLLGNPAYILMSESF